MSGESQQGLAEKKTPLRQTQTLTENPIKRQHTQRSVITGKYSVKPLQQKALGTSVRD